VSATVDTWWRLEGFRRTGTPDVRTTVIGMPHLSPADVARFTEISEGWRFALVAVREPGELVAVARYEGREGRPDAEIAVVVDDALQHRGVGRLLLGRLIDIAH
jgi:GNAT superfamily N-acetyltransferase